MAGKGFVPKVEQLEQLKVDFGEDGTGSQGGGAAEKLPNRVNSKANR